MATISALMQLNDGSLSSDGLTHATQRFSIPYVHFDPPVDTNIEQYRGVCSVCQELTRISITCYYVY